MTRITDDTIAAVTTPPGSGGVGIIRISGESAFAILDALFHPVARKTQATHGRSVPGTIVDPTDGQRLDFVLALRFFAPHSYTGENVAEIHAHGGRLNLEQILSLCLAHGARTARPGEFTLRAFLNGKLDLTRAEAVREVIESQTAAALNASRRHLQGDIATLCETARESLLDILAHIEALIDFPEEDLPPSAAADYSETIQTVSHTLGRAADSYERGRLLHEGVEVTIVGAPNVGKSSLLNRLLRSERAIVTDQPGTTRDMVDGIIDLAGLPVRFVDTAGLREAAADPVEAIGMQRAWNRLAQADLVLWVLDGSRPLTDNERTLATRLAPQRGIAILNKADRPTALDVSELIQLVPDWPTVTLSAKTGEGIDGLETALNRLLGMPSVDSDELLLTSARHQQGFRLAEQALTRTLNALEKGENAWELMAADLHEALNALEDLVGISTPDDILHRIFSRFCIGK